jgi:hypothetical protein
MELEDLRVRLETMHAGIYENKFMIHILNNLTLDYQLQLAMIERRVGDTERPLTVEKIRGELSVDTTKRAPKVTPWSCHYQG